MALARCRWAASSSSSGKNRKRLVAGEQPDQPVPGAGLAVGEGQRGDADVGVQVLVVGVGVVGVVLGDPPAVADPDQQVGVQQADQVVGGSGAGDLAVPGVVADEGELGEHHRQVGGGDQLPPGSPSRTKATHAGGEQDEIQADPGGVPAAPALQQAGLLDLPRQLGVLTPAARPRRRRPGGQLSVKLAMHPPAQLLSTGGENCRRTHRVVRGDSAPSRRPMSRRGGTPPGWPSMRTDGGRSVAVGVDPRVGCR